ncbi:hypothetical protein C7M84_024495 [Penaeus vannamei]|uniref:Uncharacterized protein n=1 Tax=Penaeus vannamei TaxID=6689 RepID=A0A423U0X5_PENVA|nr:hypothetical protein C7M84_024495 [Penaeus vannamei]
MPSRSPSAESYQAFLPSAACSPLRTLKQVLSAISPRVDSQSDTAPTCPDVHGKVPAKAPDGRRRRRAWALAEQSDADSVCQSHLPEEALGILQNRSISRRAFRRHLHPSLFSPSCLSPSPSFFTSSTSPVTLGPSSSFFFTPPSPLSSLLVLLLFHNRYFSLFYFFSSSSFTAVHLSILHLSRPLLLLHHIYRFLPCLLHRPLLSLLLFLHHLLPILLLFLHILSPPTFSLSTLSVFLLFLHHLLAILLLFLLSLPIFPPSPINYSPPLPPSPINYSPPLPPSPINYSPPLPPSPITILLLSNIPPHILSSTSLCPPPPIYSILLLFSLYSPIPFKLFSSSSSITYSLFSSSPSTFFHHHHSFYPLPLSSSSSPAPLPQHVARPAPLATHDTCALGTRLGEAVTSHAEECHKICTLSFFTFSLSLYLIENMIKI